MSDDFFSLSEQLELNTDNRMKSQKYNKRNVDLLLH